MNWKWINTAYPFEHSFEEKRNTIATISLFTSALIFLLQPYGIITVSAIDNLYNYFGFLIISTTVLSINYFGSPYFFPEIFDDKEWSMVKAFFFLVYNFIVIGFWNHIFISWINNDIEGLVSGNRPFHIYVFNGVVQATIDIDRLIQAKSERKRSKSTIRNICHYYLFSRRIMDISY